VLEFLKKRFSHNTLYDHSRSGKHPGLKNRCSGISWWRRAGWALFRKFY
jgi:hypothetical protein